MPRAELIRITPGMFIALERQRYEQTKENMLGFQFLATVVARIAGNEDANFMPEAEDKEPARPDPAVFEGWLRAKAAAANPSATATHAGPQ